MVRGLLGRGLRQSGRPPSCRYYSEEQCSDCYPTRNIVRPCACGTGCLCAVYRLAIIRFSPKLVRGFPTRDPLSVPTSESVAYLLQNGIATEGSLFQVTIIIHAGFAARCYVTRCHRSMTKRSIAGTKIGTGGTVTCHKASRSQSTERIPRAATPVSRGAAIGSFSLGWGNVFDCWRPAHLIRRGEARVIGTKPGRHRRHAVARARSPGAFAHFNSVFMSARANPSPRKSGSVLYVYYQRGRRSSYRNAVMRDTW